MYWNSHITIFLGSQLQTFASPPNFILIFTPMAATGYVRSAVIFATKWGDMLQYREELLFTSFFGEHFPYIKILCYFTFDLKWAIHPYRTVLWNLIFVTNFYATFLSLYLSLSLDCDTCYQFHSTPFLVLNIDPTNPIWVDHLGSHRYWNDPPVKIISTFYLFSLQFLVWVFGSSISSFLHIFSTNACTTFCTLPFEIDCQNSEIWNLLLIKKHASTPSQDNLAHSTRWGTLHRYTAEFFAF